MDNFEIKLGRINAILNMENKVSRQLRSCQREVNSICSGLNFHVASEHQIRSRLKTIVSDIGQENGQVTGLSTGLSQIADLYRTSEGKIYQNVTGQVMAAAEASDGSRKPVISLFGLLGLVLADPGEKNYDDLLVVDGVEKWLEKKINLDDCEDAVNQFFTDKHIRNEIKSKGYSDKDGTYHEIDQEDKKDDKKEKGTEKKEQSEEEKEYDRNHIDKLAGLTLAGVKYEDSLWSKGDEKASVSVLKVEAVAQAYGGLYTIGEDGQKHLRLGMGAEVGVGVTAFTAEAEQEIGSEMLGVYGQAEVTVGKMEAKGSIDAALFDKDGNFDPVLQGRVDAEAILAEASVSGGAMIGGTKIGGKASINFGIGAHAEAGYHDGKFTFDLGASIGVGFSLKAEIDVSGTIEAVSGACHNFFSKAKNFFGW